MPDVIETERLRLVRWAPEHVDQVLKALAISIDDLRPWMPWASAVPTRGAELWVIGEARQRFDSGLMFSYFVFEREGAEELVGAVDLQPGDEELAGAVGFHLRKANDPEARQVRAIGYWTRTDRVRRGYASEAVKALTEVAFDKLSELASIEIRMDRANLASVGVAVKAGYDLVGEVDAERTAPGNTGRQQVWIRRRAARAVRPGTTGI